MSRHHLLFVISSLSIVGCFPKSAPPPSSVADEVVAHSQVDRATLEEGRRIFVARCAECHDHPEIQAVSADEWPEILRRMSEKAKLNEHDAATLRDFVLASSEK